MQKYNTEYYEQGGLVSSKGEYHKEKLKEQPKGKSKDKKKDYSEQRKMKRGE